MLAVLGHPIAHSRSPAMHNAALAVLARDDARFSSWRYSAVDVVPEQLHEALPRFLAEGFVGLNLTVPHKVISLPLLASVDPLARAIGAVNTLLATPQGWHGTNTDGHGLEAGIQEDLHLSLASRDIVLLGAGGAARSAAVQCLHSGCTSLCIVNRSAPNLNALLENLRPLPGSNRARGLLSADANATTLPPGALYINATSSGLHAGDPLPFDLSLAPRPLAAYDMIYNPPETPWLAQARRLGLPAANGLSMLVHQGAAALTLWTGRPAPLAIMTAAARP
ncbi:shikimate dehydrogenase [Nibricoccus sp. IMCC34717]|uniref:shikimate dehydrogenase n=1 Tax=Nibricoccus sp. IMCC34717 TaxID=3034021 RepID=UPI00384F5FBA